MILDFQTQGSARCEVLCHLGGGMWLTRLYTFAGQREVADMRRFESKFLLDVVSTNDRPELKKLVKAITP